MTAAKLVSIKPEETDIRLDRWFKRHYPGLSHSLLQKWMRTGQVRVDGKRVKANVRLESGQMVRVPPGADDIKSKDKPAVAAINRSDRKILLNSILFQDEEIIAINKPPGLAVQGGSKTHRHLDAMLDALKFDANERPRLVHRLDKDTSGVLVLARTVKTASYLSQVFKSRKANKIYWAIVVGNPKPKSGLIKSALEKRGGSRGEQMQAVSDGGKHAITSYRVIDHAGQKAAWLELKPQTGRTHQLRVHCASMNTPILGDRKYGGAKAVVPGVEFSRKRHLHACALDLPHPNGQRFQITAPLPDFMQKTWLSFGFEIHDFPLEFEE